MSTATAEKHSNRFVPGDPRAIAAGKKSAEARAKKKQEREAREAEREELIDRFLAVDCSGETLGDAARSAAALIIQEILGGRVRITDGRQAAALLAKCHEIARLESGQVTSLTGRVSLQLGDEEVRRRIESARASLDPVALSSDTVTPQVTGPAPLPHEDDAPAPAMMVHEAESPSD